MSDAHLRRTIACPCAACGAQPLKPCATLEGEKLGIYCLIPKGQEPILDWETLAFNATALYEDSKEPIPLRLPCERCGNLHIDVGEFATKPHHTHTCQHCGLTWRPAKEHTVGVQWIPGWKNAEPPEAIPGWKAGAIGELIQPPASWHGVMGQTPWARGIHIGSKWQHVTGSDEYTVTHVDNDNQFHCMSGVTEWIGTEAEFRKQFIWVRNP